MNRPIDDFCSYRFDHFENNSYPVFALWEIGKHPRIARLQVMHRKVRELTTNLHNILTLS